MAVEAHQLVAGETRVARPAEALEAFAAATRCAGDEPTLAGALDVVVRATAAAAGASVVVARVVDADRMRASVRAVHSPSQALAAELEGSRVDVDELPLVEVDGPLEPTLDRLVRRSGGQAGLHVPVVVRGVLAGSLELVGQAPFGPAERFLARLAADQVGAAVRMFESDSPRGELADGGARRLELAGDALAAGADRMRTPDEIVRLAAESTGATAGVLWRRARADGRPVPAAAFPARAAIVAAGAEGAAAAFDTVAPLVLGEVDGAAAVAIPLGRPPAFVLQLTFADGGVPQRDERERLAIFGVRAAHALLATERARALELELDRSRALLAAVAQASEHLSLAHTLSTVVGRVGELLETDRIVVYLREEDVLTTAAGELEGRHEQVAQRLLALALGPFRGRGMLVIEDAAGDARLNGVESAAASAEIEAAVAVPLLVPDEVVGLLAAYPPRGRVLTENESTMLSALAAQLAVTVQNARLHERATQLTAERERDLAELQRKEENLRALYEISRSFAHDLSLETTLDAVARTVAELLAVDAAVIRMPDGRGEQLVPRAMHIVDPRLEAPLRHVLSRPQPLEALLGRRLLRAGRPLVLDAELAYRLPGYALLAPFLEKGSTAVILPIATPSELLGTLSLFSLDPARPLTPATTELALSIAGQSALALDNARLYQQQKQFADSMQRSLLPRTRPELPGVEVGAIYESSARVDVGGDVYDFMTLADGRLAVVLGDVTGHGTDAAADMAMAKFVFRCLARSHPEPADFLAAANDIVCGEIAPGKFITMVYVTLDAESGELRVASAGHPDPRVVTPDGVVRPVEARGLVLGIDQGQTYEEVHEQLPPGTAVIVYTDGLVEARRGGELYGTERLDRVLSENRDLDADELALAVMEDCRAWSGGELADDCALVVIKRADGDGG